MSKSFQPPVQQRAPPQQATQPTPLALQNLLGNAALQQALPVQQAAPSKKRPLDQMSAVSTPLATQASKRSKYEPWQHGAKKGEQKRLTADYGNKVSGSTHESEHTIGFEPLNQTTGLKRGKGDRARGLENHAPAYQEKKAYHRDNIGTGTTGDVGAHGFNSHTYRATQRAALEQGDPSTAVQVNQLSYAHMPGFQTDNTWDMLAADNSFGHMVQGMNQVTYGVGDQSASVPVGPMAQVEMLLARNAARTGAWPGDTDLRDAWRLLGFDVSDSESDQDGGTD